MAEKLIGVLLIVLLFLLVVGLNVWSYRRMKTLSAEEKQKEDEDIRDDIVTW